MRKTKSVLLIVLLAFAACSKGERARAMEVELKDKVEKAFVNGGSRAEIDAFIDKLAVDGEKPTRQPFTSDLSGLGSGAQSPYKPEKNLERIKGYVLADFGSVDSDINLMCNVVLHAMFFFDEQDKLVEYRVYRTFRC
jgi:hypothetical protein